MKEITKFITKIIFIILFVITVYFLEGYFIKQIWESNLPEWQKIWILID